MCEVYNGHIVCRDMAISSILCWMCPSERCDNYKIVSGLGGWLVHSMIELHQSDSFYKRHNSQFWWISNAIRITASKIFDLTNKLPHYTFNHIHTYVSNVLLWDWSTSGRFLTNELANCSSETQKARPFHEKQNKCSSIKTGSLFMFPGPVL
jgi:hypothetical protein